jgi:molybdopterin-binding protein
MTLAAGQGYAQAANATVNFVFWNPQNSNTMLSLLKFSFVTLSGTPAAGEVNYQISAGNVITSTDTGVHVNTLTASIKGSAAKSWVKTSAASIAGTVAFNDLRPAFGQTATAASTTTGTLATDLLDGEILIMPGGAFTFGVGGAGTTHVASVGLVWEELPLLL